MHACHPTLTYTAPPYPTLPYPTLPYPTLPYPPTLLNPPILTYHHDTYACSQLINNVSLVSYTRLTYPRNVPLPMYPPFSHLVCLLFSHTLLYVDIIMNDLT